MSGQRRICVVTGTRAEYGLLYWLMHELRDDPDLCLQIVATGMHLSPEFGLTYKTIESDGFTIDEKVEILLSSDTPVGIATSTGLGVMLFAQAFNRLAPDIVVVLGDRFEILAAAQAAMIGRLPIAHLHGGESTEGLIDEAIRHAITKMSHLHFVAADPYRKRVLQMGEGSDRVFNVGAPGLDHLQRTDWLSKQKLERDLGMALDAPLFLVTYHPVTLEKTSPAEPMGELLTALDQFPHAKVIITHPNADTDGRILIRLIEDYAQRNRDRVRAVTSLGQQRYLSLMRQCDVVLGNSSSGLTEAPALKKATVNLGSRQKGRLKADSVIDCDESSESIETALKQALSEGFRSGLKKVQSMYGEGNASASIKAVLKNVDVDSLIIKEFHDQ